MGLRMNLRILKYSTVLTERKNWNYCLPINIGENKNLYIALLQILHKNTSTYNNITPTNLETNDRKL